MRFLSIIRSTPNELPIEMDCCGTDILTQIFCQFDSSRENIFRLRHEFGKYALKGIRVGWVSQASGEQVRCSTVSDHPGQEEIARGLHRQPDAGEWESEFGLWRCNTA
jgi:hypothetical protein